MCASDPDNTFINRPLCHGFSRSRSLIDAMRSLFQLGNQALAYPRRIRHAMSAIPQRAIMQLGYQHARLRTSYIQHRQQLFRLAHACFLWGWVTGRAFATGAFGVAGAAGVSVAAGALSAIFRTTWRS